MAVTEYPIDENEQLILQLENSTDGVRARVTSRYQERSKLVEHIVPLLSFEAGESVIRPATAAFDLRVPEDGKLTLRINNHVFADIVVRGEEIDVQPVRKLSVSETRIIGRYSQAGKVKDEVVPYPLPAQETVLTPITDLHTHLSAQVASKDLIDIGLKHDVLYPVAALTMAGIALPDAAEKIMIPKRVFLPLAHLRKPGDPKEEAAIRLSALSKEALGALQNALNITPEGQGTYEDMERCYYLREPFTKDNKLLPDVLRKVAEGYRDQGIRYAELAATEVLKLDWLRIVHDVLPQIEQDTGVQLRFLAGLPRNLKSEDIEDRIEQFKRVSRSPYVVGVDVLGYEMNKTSHLGQHLEALANWMSEHAPDMVLRIHAGENSKNAQNVLECLRLADHPDRKNLRLRVGHAVHGIDDTTMALAIALAAEGRLIVEFNPDSNLALNNIDYVDRVPIAKFLNSGIPSVLASDGAGMYCTSANQIALAGLFGGVAADGFRYIRETEEAYIAAQQHIFDEKQKQFSPYFFSGVMGGLPKRKTPPKPAEIDHIDAPGELEGVMSSDRTKRPIFVLGAAGTSWELINSDQRKELAIGLKMLVELLDPGQVYFVTGRTKDRGVGIELGKIIAEYNATHDKPFGYTMMLADKENGSPYIPAGISHKVELTNGVLNLPSTILGFVRRHNGVGYFIGGAQFTRDFAKNFIESGIPSGVMKDVPGASAEKSRIYSDQSFSGAVGMVEHAMKLHPEMFLSLPSHAQLVEAYQRHSNPISIV